MLFWKLLSFLLDPLRIKHNSKDRDRLSHNCFDWFQLIVYPITQLPSTNQLLQVPHVVSWSWESQYQLSRPNQRHLIKLQFFYYTLNLCDQIMISDIHDPNLLNSFLYLLNKKQDNHLILLHLQPLLRLIKDLLNQPILYLNISWTITL